MSQQSQTAIVTLCAKGLRTSRRIANAFEDCLVFAHVDVENRAKQEVPFQAVRSLTKELFHRCRQLVFVLPIGVAVRSISALAVDKLTDPAIVGVDVGGRWAVSLLSGHEGGANRLALRIANTIDAEPIISTTTQAAKDLIVGIGCRRNTQACDIQHAIQDTLFRYHLKMEAVRLLASADIKRDEPGLLQAAREMKLDLRFVSSQEIRACTRQFESSALVEKSVNLPAVSQPAALLAGRRTELLVPKQKYPRVTIAIAKENCTWLE